MREHFSYRYLDGNSKRPGQVGCGWRVGQANSDAISELSETRTQTNKDQARTLCNHPDILEYNNFAPCAYRSTLSQGENRLSC